MCALTTDTLHEVLILAYFNHWYLTAGAAGTCDPPEWSDGVSMTTKKDSDAQS